MIDAVISDHKKGEMLWDMVNQAFCEANIEKLGGKDYQKWDVCEEKIYTAIHQVLGYTTD